jgi:hypothetical protein
VTARTVDRILGLLEGLVPVARALAASARTLAVLATGAAAVIAVLLLRDGFPDGGEERLELVVALVLAAAPPLVLLAFWLAVREVAQLPARLRSLPETGREQAAELGRLASDARTRGGWLRFPRLLWRFGFLVGSARETVTPWAPLLPLLSVPFLLLTAAASVAAVFEVLIALVALLALAL